MFCFTKTHHQTLGYIVFGTQVIILTFFVVLKLNHFPLIVFPKFIFRVIFHRPIGIVIVIFKLSNGLNFVNRSNSQWFINSSIYTAFSTPVFPEPTIKTGCFSDV